MADLPAHLSTGRTNFSGPATGALTNTAMGPLVAVAANQAADDTGIRFRFGPLPFDLRLQRVLWTARSVADSATVVFSKNTSFTLTGATNLVVDSAGSDVTVDLDANTTGGAVAGSETAITSTYKLKEAARNCSRGDFLFASVSTNGTGTIADMNVQFVYHITGQPNAQAGND